MSRSSVVLLAPTAVGGGIGTWTRTVMADPRLSDWELVDSTRPDQTLGMELSERLRRYAAHDFRVRLSFVIALRQAPRATAWMAVSPGPGFLLRDLPIALLIKSKSHRVVMHFHGGRLEGFLGRSGMRRRAIVRALKRMDAIVVMSAPMLASMKDAGLEKSTVLVGNPLPEGPHPAWLSNSSGPILLPAFQVPEKGTFVAIEALVQIPQAELRLVGDVTPQMRRAINDLARELGVADRIATVGRLRHDEVLEEMARAGVVILPSASEGFPMVIAEALSVGVPVVATDVGAIPEMLHASGDAVMHTVVSYSGDARHPCRVDSLVDAILRIRQTDIPNSSDQSTPPTGLSAFDRTEIVTRLIDIARGGLDPLADNGEPVRATGQ